MEEITELTEGQYVYHPVHGGCQVVDLDWEFDDRKMATGQVKLKTGQETIIEDAADFETHIVGGECFEIDERVFNEPEAVVNEFAQHELNNYLGTAPFTHEYNGIEGVDRIGGIATALALVQD